MFSVFAGIYYWYPKITGRMLDETLSKAHFWLFFVGFQLTFLLQHVLGMLGMPRLVYTYPASLPGYGHLNLISTAGAFLMGFGMLALIFNLVRSARKGELAGRDPWGGTTLEWWAASPPDPKNFGTLPEVLSKDPLLDWKVTG